MDKSIKDSFVQEIRNEITHRINKCETLRTDFEDKLPDYFVQKGKQATYMTSALTVSIAFLAIGILFSEAIENVFSIPWGFILAMFITFSIYFFTLFLVYRKRLKQIKEVDFYKADINSMISALNNDLVSLENTASIVEESFETGKQFPILHARKTDEKIAFLSSEATAICYEKHSPIDILNSILSCVSAVFFSVVCNCIFMIEGNMDIAGIFIAIVNVVLLVLAIGFIYQTFERLNVLLFLAGLVSPFAAFALCAGVVIAAGIAFVGLCIVAVGYLIGIILGGG